MKKHNAQHHQRMTEKARRRHHREVIAAKRKEANHAKRNEQFRKQGLARISEATRALLAGAKAAGIDIRPEDIHGKINSRGEGALIVSDRVNPADVRRVQAKVEEMERKAVIHPDPMPRPTVRVRTDAATPRTVQVDPGTTAADLTGGNEP